MERNPFKVVRSGRGINIFDTLTRLEYRDDSTVFLKRKVRLCIKGDQQLDGESFLSSDSDLHAPTLKAREARLLAAIAAEHGCPLCRKLIPGKHSSTEKWKKTKRCTSTSQTGGRNYS
jgi:hypothetical protein